MDQLLQRYDFVISPATAIPAFGAGLELPDSSLRLGAVDRMGGLQFPDQSQPAAGFDRPLRPNSGQSADRPADHRRARRRRQSARRRPRIRNRVARILSVKRGAPRTAPARQGMTRRDASRKPFSGVSNVRHDHRRRRFGGVRARQSAVRRSGAEGACSRSGPPAAACLRHSLRLGDDVQHRRRLGVSHRAAGGLPGTPRVLAARQDGRRLGRAERDDLHSRPSVRL